jgi:hypothetical protein
VCSAKIRSETQSILALPYEPGHWLLRADSLLTLGYPELAVGDAYKARLLTQAGLAEDESDLGEQVLLSHGMGYWYRDPDILKQRANGNFRANVVSSLRRLENNAWALFVRGLMHTGAVADIISFRKIITERSLLTTDDLRRLDNMYEEKKRDCANVSTKWESGERFDQSNETARNGFVRVRAYPWMSTKILTREHKTTTRSNLSLISLSDSRCTLARSGIQDGLTKEMDIYGIFASENIRAGELVFTDHTVTAVTTRSESCSICFKDLGKNLPRKLSCCSTQFCSQACEEIALNSFHHATCQRDVSLHGLQEYEPIPRLRILLLQRFLEIIVQWHQQSNNSTSHPLLSPIIDYLKPNYSGDSMPWTFKEAIEWPIEILQKLGIDVFADLQYDTWVMKTIADRIKNNATNAVERGEYITAINPFHCMLNHSCHANVDWKFFEGRSSIVLSANRNIEKGEEIFDSYRSQVKWQPREKRQESLRSWLGTDCGCERCRAEGSGQVAAKAYWLKYISTCSQDGKAELDSMIKQSALHGAYFMPFIL